jgi:hypothetical protein
MAQLVARTLLLSALTFASIASSAAETSADDASVVDRAGCRVRTERVDGRGVATVAADCQWPVASEALVAALRDPEKLGEVLSSLVECRRLPDGRVLQVHSVGWPLEDRQVTLDWREEPLAGGGVRIDVHRANRQEPLSDGRVAILESESHWEIRPDGAGGTRLTYRSRYDAGGNLKPWLVRRFQKNGVAASLEELRIALASR